MGSEWKGGKVAYRQMWVFYVRTCVFFYNVIFVPNIFVRQSTVLKCDRHVTTVNNETVFLIICGIFAGNYPNFSAVTQESIPQFG